MILLLPINTLFLKLSPVSMVEDLEATLYPSCHYSTRLSKLGRVLWMPSELFLDTYAVTLVANGC